MNGHELREHARHERCFLDKMFDQVQGKVIDQQVAQR